MKLGLLICVMLFACFLSAGVHKIEAISLQRGIQKEVLRFHVLANSDSEEDQAVKLKVRDDILNWLEKNLSETEQNDLIQMKKKVKVLLPQIEQEAAKIIKENGMDYEAEAELATSMFPAKSYGDCTFPAGKYSALKIRLGDAKGHNWWCVLFPRLCFMDCVEAVVPEQSQQLLQKVLTEEEYESLFDPAEDEYRIEFRYF